MKPDRIIFLAFAALALGACATGPRVHSLHDPATDFGRYATYDFAPEAGQGGGEKYRSFLTQYLEQAITREMDNRGYRRSETPDLLINFNVQTREKVDVHEMPRMRASRFYYPHYYSYRFGFYDPWPYYAYETRVVQYTEGTLNIDLIDAARKQLVWEGVAIGRVRESDRENLRERVNEVVASVFGKYPFEAGRSEPVVSGEK
jgi:hypothetical protein